MKYKIENTHLERRKIKRFAWFPIIIKDSDKLEIRWMERVTIEQQWNAFVLDLRTNLFGGYWKNKCFI